MYLFDFKSLLDVKLEGLKDPTSDLRETKSFL